MNRACLFLQRANINDGSIRSGRCLSRLFLTLLCVTSALMASPDIAWGQQVTATITGKVTDPSGAAIPGATVTAKDLQRGTAWPTVTNSEGFYNLPRVPVGTYEIRVELAGFKTAVHPAVVLELNQTARVDFEMKLGEVSETVEVTSAPPLLNTDTMQVGTIIDSKVNEALPLASRNYIQLTLLAPGTTNPDPSSMKNPLTTGQGGRPYVNGNREQANNFMLDGVDNNHVSDNLVGYTPSPDAIQEFNMITNNAPADFGNFQGGIVNATIKSGTNQFHGTAFEFFRNDVLNANNWAANWSGGGKDKMRWNMFGGTLGGPIKKDKLFFFGDYQGIRYNTPASTGPITVFTVKERSGDFSELLALPKPIQLYNPYSTRPDPNNPQKTIRDPFPNNQIPITMINPVAKNLFASSLYPLPINGQVQNNQLNTSSSQQIGDQFDIKIDYNLTDKDKISGRFSNSRQNNPGNNSFPLFFGSFFEAPAHNGVIDWTRTFGSRFVNDVRIGVNYVRLHNGGTDGGVGDLAEKLGIQSGNDRGPGLFGINFSGGLVNGFGSGNIGTQQLFPSTVIQVEDSLIWTRASHSFHMGFQFFRDRINPFYAGNYGRTGNMTFDGRYTAGPGVFATSGGGSGLAEADFFLGLPEDVQRGVNTGNWGHRSSTIGAYLQDNWRATNNLTLNLGLRYETHTPWVEVKDRQVNFAPLSGEIQFAGKSTYYENNRALYNPYNWGIGNFQPRFGFSWNPDFMNKTFVARGAYTISAYLEGTGTNLRLPLNPPFTTEFNSLYDALPFPASTLDQGMTILKSPTDPYANAVIRLWDPNIKPAIAQQWNFSIESQFGNETTLTVGYVGQKGTHLMVPMPYFQRQLLGLNPDGSPKTAPSPFLAGNPALKNISQISGTESNGTMRYDALQTVLRKRFSAGLQYQVAYTFSKAMENSSGYYGSWSGQVYPNSPYWQNLYDGRSEWGPAFFDVKHMLTSYAVYELPVGTGKKFGSNWNPVARNVIGNWSVTGMLSLRGGFPTSMEGSDASGTGSRGARPSCNGPHHTFGTKNASDGGYQWFDPSPYSNAAPGTFGTCGNGTEYGPGLRELDMSFQKNFRVTERYRVEFRSEFINFTNTPILGPPVPWIGASMGKVIGSQGPRNIQFGLKIHY